MDAFRLGRELKARQFFMSSRSFLTVRPASPMLSDLQRENKMNVYVKYLSMR